MYKHTIIKLRKFVTVRHCSIFLPVYGNKQSTTCLDDYSAIRSMHVFWFLQNTPDSILNRHPSQGSQYLDVPEHNSQPRPSKHRPSSCVTYLTLESVPEAGILGSQSSSRIARAQSIDIGRKSISDQKLSRFASSGMFVAIGYNF